jgi:hypothetical protein
LLTNSYNKLSTPLNTNICDGSFRCLDLSAEPYFLDGAYVLEFTSPLWEKIRTFLHEPRSREWLAQPEPRLKAAISRSLIMLQTSDPFVYNDMLKLTAAVNIEYCRRHNFGYESYVGIKSGVVPWMASYNRIYMLDELIQRDYRGWVIFADADAFVVDFSFDIFGYLTENSDYCLIGASGGSEAPWNLNSGILFIDLNDPTGRAFVADWMMRFQDELPLDHLASPTAEWDEFPNDQALMYECIKNVPGLMAKTKREEANIFNYHNGQFMRQAIRVGYQDMEGRLNWIRTVTNSVWDAVK